MPVILSPEIPCPACRNNIGMVVKHPVRDGGRTVILDLIPVDEDNHIFECPHCRTEFIVSLSFEEIGIAEEHPIKTVVIYKGKKVSDMSREELTNALIETGQAYSNYLKQTISGWDLLAELMGWDKK